MDKLVFVGFFVRSREPTALGQQGRVVPSTTISSTIKVSIAMFLAKLILSQNTRTSVAIEHIFYAQTWCEERLRGR